MKKRPAIKEYQSRAISYALENPYCIIALDPGLGKSLVAIEVRKKLKCRCLVVCPSYLILNWEKEILKWDNTKKILKFKSGKELRIPDSDTEYVITSYDLIQKAEYLVEWAELVALDEGHSIKSMKAKRTTFVHKSIYENSTKRVLILTGTPIKNRVQEFYSLLALCFYNPSVADSRFLELFPSEIDFADHFSYREEYTITVRNRMVNLMKWRGLKNVEELRKWLEGKYFRVRSADVLDLPPLTYKSTLISDTPDEALLESFNEHFGLDGSGDINPTAKAEAALEKVPFTIKYAENLLEEVECLLVYTDHVASAEALARGLGVTAITGKIPANTRSVMADAFQAGQGKILVATIGSMKEGKDLFRASHIIFNDLPWVPGDLKQVIYRIQRIGQTSPCTVHKILGSPQDEYIADALQEKIEVIERAT
jgi:SNF2 family DNA or RNA helicase